tara:strand:+ start:2445 stop:3599 length:1155 start_codon:yes stop_codon:yes gene_type:complete
MKIKIIISLILISAATFSYGLFVGHYEIFPFEILSEIKKIPYESESNTRLQIYQDLSNDDLISFQSIADIDNTKQTLIEYIWNDSKLPIELPTKHEYDVKDRIADELQNLDRIDSFTVEMKYGVNSISYLFIAKNSNDKLVIYHQGHNAISLNGFDDHSFDQDIPLIQNFLDNNYSVLIFSMPGKGMNNEPIIDHEKFGNFKLNSHDHFHLLEAKNFHPIQFFLEPVVITLNQIEKDYSFVTYSMMGLSGGGWTTIVVSAVDDRISESYSIAGSFPIWLRSDSRDYGDYEQTIPEFYQIANYEELYFLSAYGDNRRLVLFYNEFDPCCFPGELYNKFPFGDIVKTKISKFNKGNFDVIVDYGQTEHMISESILGKITEYIQNNS